MQYFPPSCKVLGLSTTYDNQVLYLDKDVKGRRKAPTSCMICVDLLELCELVSLAFFRSDPE